MQNKIKHPVYNVWASMRERCRNPNNRAWNSYGGRGIKICKRWDDFETFAADMGPRPPGYSLDRIDNDKGYSPENCRWASRREQQLNRRVAVYVEIEGRRYRAIELAEKAGVKTDTIVARAKKGLPYDKVVTAKPQRDLSGLSLGAGARKKIARERTHCAKGHAFDEANTRYTKQGYKRCRACHAEKMRRYTAQKLNAKTPPA